VALPQLRPVGVEVLPRWRHPTLGTVTAAELLAVTDGPGRVDEVGEWTLHRALRQLSGWLRNGWDIWLSINVSTGQLAEPAFVGAFTAALDAYQVPASRLVLEFAEAGLTSRRDGPVDPAADARAQAMAAHLTELRTLGVRAALDHFGLQYTPLSQLRVLPLDLVKLDRLLLDEAANHTGPASAIVDAVVNFAHQLGVDVAAQGLRTGADLDAAVSAGCRLAQGDLISRAVLPEHLEAYLDRHRASPFRRPT
jgi:EAL domain-containing protein (putative c-di-GMP-specific phosphodiesterase class I)